MKKINAIFYTFYIIAFVCAHWYARDGLGINIYNGHSVSEASATGALIGFIIVIPVLCIHILIDKIYNKKNKPKK